MTSAELSAWVRYSEEFGPLSLSWRIDYAVARAVAPFVGGKDVMAQFMPYPKRQPEGEREATVEELMAILGGARVKKDGTGG